MAPLAPRVRELVRAWSAVFGVVVLSAFGWASNGCAGGEARPSASNGDVVDGGNVDASDTVEGACPGSYAPPIAIDVAEPALVEASGIAASKRNAGVLWIHNDSGDSARVFVIGDDGSALGELALPGVTAHDFEDIETAACPDGSGPCVWVADLGNNALDRDDLAIYAMPEPLVTKASPLGHATAAKLWAFPIAYPPGVAIDSEALLVAPDASGLWVFEKIDAASARVFGTNGHLKEGMTNVLDELGSLTSPGVAIANGRMITGADMHPSERRVLVRAYTGVFEYRLEPGQSPAHLDAASRRTVALGPFSEKQGEAVAYDQNGRGIWTISEDPSGKTVQPLHHYLCIETP